MRRYCSVSAAIFEMLFGRATLKLNGFGTSSAAEPPNLHIFFKIPTLIEHRLRYDSAKLNRTVVKTERKPASPHERFNHVAAEDPGHRG
jgi:hypothetical protein